MPNVKGDNELIEAIKTVWASLWNFEAYEARERAGIDHSKVYMAVLLQKGINADSAGVMITADPYNPESKNAIYISAKRGLGIKVVDGKRMAEQILFRPQSNAIQVLTRSAEDSLLTFDEKRWRERDTNCGRADSVNRRDGPATGSCSAEDSPSVWRKRSGHRMALPAWTALHRPGPSLYLRRSWELGARKRPRHRGLPT